MFIGGELAYHPEYSKLEKLYIRTLGVPIVGLRIRARNVFSLVPQSVQYRKILDAGCGLGVFSFRLARLFPAADVLGVDLLENSVQGAEYIRTQARIANLRFEKGDITSLPYTGRFDLVICVDILEHIKDDLGAMEGLFRAMAPGGQLVLHVPALYRRYPVWKKSQNFDVETHVRPGYELPAIQQLIKKAGFSLQSAGYTYGFWETFANNLSYMITKARMQNKHLYALAFPFLNLLSLLGARARPSRLGAGIYVLAQKGRLGSSEKCR